MSIRFQSPVFTAFDANGDQISGAKLNFYESGTTTRLDTFSDEGLTTPNANPVVADSAGRFPSIFLKEQDYKVVLTDAADATIWTRDPVQGALTVTGDDFKVSQQSPADMTVQVSAGSLYDLATKARVTKTAQTSVAITAPVTNPRYDTVHINSRTGVIGITTGTEAASPADPTLAEGLLPLARISLAATTTEITSSEITDQRELRNLGLINTDGGLTLYSDDAGAAKEPSLILDRDSASPAASDFLGSAVFRGESSTGADVDYAELIAQIIDPTNASEDARAILRAMVAGALTNIITAGPGVVVGSETDQGVGTLNATTLYQGGTAILTNTGVTEIEIVRKASDETVNNSSTLQNDNELLFAIAANEEVYFEAIIIQASNATADFKFGFTWPTGATVSWNLDNSVIVSTAATAITVDDITVSGNSNATSGSSTSANRQVKACGFISNGANAGNVQLQWAQNTANASDTVVKAGSRLIVYHE